MTQIAILVADSSPANTLAATRSGGINGRVLDIATDKLQASLNALCDSMSVVLQDTQQIGGFALKEVKLQVEISAEGSIVLIGKAGVSGAISLTFAPASLLHNEVL